MFGHCVSSALYTAAKAAVHRHFCPGAVEGRWRCQNPHMPTTLGSGTEPGERDERAGQIVVVLADVCGHPHQKLGTSVMAVIP